MITDLSCIQIQSSKDVIIDTVLEFVITSNNELKNKTTKKREILEYRKWYSQWRPRPRESGNRRVRYTHEAVKTVKEVVEPEHQQSRENEGEQRAGEHHAPRSEIRLCEAGIEGGDDGNTNSNGHSCQDNLSLQEKARGSNEYGQDDGLWA